jgi:hypothetical protein
MLFGTVVSGLGFGSVFSGALRSVMPLAQPDERAALLSAFYVEGYLAFTLPAMLAGFLAPVVGLTRAADFYGVAVIFLALASLWATTFWKMNRWSGAVKLRRLRGSASDAASLAQHKRQAYYIVAYYANLRRPGMTLTMMDIAGAMHAIQRNPHNILLADTPPPPSMMS